MLLHHDEELFREVIFSTAADLNLSIPIVEKDYYVTILLKELSEQVPLFLIRHWKDLFQTV